jgi:hypothetical protein
MLKKYGVKEFIFSLDTLLLVSVFVLCMYLSDMLIVANELEFLRGYSSLLIGISSGILGIVIAALAIIVSLINESFLNAIHESDSYFDFVFPFYINSFYWIVSIILNLAIYFGTFLVMPYAYTLMKVLISFSLAVLISGLKGLFDLVGTSIGLGLYRNEFLSRSKKN